MNKIGFGFLRLPTKDDKNIDYELVNQLVDLFIRQGGRYFDTAYTYLNGLSENAIKKCVVERYERSRLWIVDKLPSWKVTSHEECFQYFNEQLERCGVSNFDGYLLHWLNRENYAIAEKYDEFGFLQQLKKEGKVKKIGFSYHDGADLLEEILSKHPEVDIVQLQINYLDWESSTIESKNCYEVVKKHHKSVVVMEPVKGGTLAMLPEQAEQILKEIHPDESSASWALRFVQSLDGVDVVLSGMNEMSQMQDNMRDIEKLNDIEYEALDKVKKIFEERTAIPCTGCRYCVNGCPQKILIPDLFKIYNEYYRYPSEDWKMQPQFDTLMERSGSPSDCIGCKKCERSCPQKIQITEWLKTISEKFIS